MYLIKFGRRERIVEFDHIIDLALSESTNLRMPRLEVVAQGEDGAHAPRLRLDASGNVRSDSPIGRHSGIIQEADRPIAPRPDERGNLLL